MYTYKHIYKYKHMYTYIYMYTIVYTYICMHTIIFFDGLFISLKTRLIYDNIINNWKKNEISKICKIEEYTIHTLFILFIEGDPAYLQLNI
jgi:hypothetical protein